MPLLAGSLNLAWEINALVLSNAFWGHILWLGLDVFIIAINTYNLRRISSRILYCLMTVAFAVFLRQIFLVPHVDGVLISVFAIDFIMAVDFLINARKISLNGKILIASTKLLGDFFAWLTYANASLYVTVIGAIVFLINLYYIAICLDESAKNNKLKRVRR